MTMTLAEAIHQRLRERRQAEIDRENERKLAELEKKLLIANIENAVRQAFVDKLGINLPDELPIEIYNLQTQSHHFGFCIRPRGKAHISNVNLTNLCSYSNEGITGIDETKKWYARCVHHDCFFRSFLDAMIYALGGEQGLREMGVIR